MRKAALLALPLALSGCAGMGKFFNDTALWSGSNPNAPHGDSENLRRARGEFVAAAPILPEGGNMWPGSPQPLPTLKDVVNPDSVFNKALGDPATYFVAPHSTRISWAASPVPVLLAYLGRR